MDLEVFDSILAQVGAHWPIILLQAIGLFVIMWIWHHSTYSHNEKHIPEVVINTKVGEKLLKWQPQGLVPVADVKDRILHPVVVQSKAGKFITIRDKKCLNIGSFNFLDFVGNKKIEEYAIQNVRNYGVGSCGPRGFFGTVDVHLDLEERLAKFMGVQDAIVYAYGFSAIASAIPAYAKRGDVIFVDEMANFAIQQGVVASRSKVKFFKHNNWMDLEVLLMEQAELDKKNPQKAKKTRRFLIIEGIYLDTGIVCDLPNFMKLKDQYKLRLFIDESVSFGAVGGGRGITSYYNIPISQVDLIMGNLEYAVGSIGGFCVGSNFVIEHQRLSGLGYCFSASLPPLHAASVIMALDIMEDNPEIFDQLEATCKHWDKCLRKLEGLTLGGIYPTPVRHLYLCPEYVNDIEPVAAILEEIASCCVEKGVAIVSPAYLEGQEKFEKEASLRVCINRKFSSKEIEDCCNVIQEACNYVLGIETSEIREARIYRKPNNRNTEMTNILAVKSSIMKRNGQMVNNNPMVRSGIKMKKRCVYMGKEQAKSYLYCLSQC